MDFLGLRRSGSWSQIINQAQDVGEQASRDCDLGKVERHIATVADDLGADLDRLLAQSQQCPLRVTSRLHGHCVDTSAPRAEAEVIGGKADVEIEGLLSARERTFSRQAQKVRL